MKEGDHILEALDASGVGVWSWSVEQDSVRWSDQCCVIFGVPIGSPPENIEAYLGHIYEDDQEHMRQTVETALTEASDAKRPAGFRVEHRVQHPDGTIVWIECRGRIEVDAEGRPRRALGMVLDVTARKAAEATIKQSEETFRLYAELASDYVYRVDFTQPNLIPSVVAGSFERTTGMTPEDVVKRGGWPEVMHPDDRPGAAQVIADVQAGKPLVVEYRIVDGNGDVRWLRDRIRPVVEPDGSVSAIQGAVQDVTEHKTLELQLLEAQKHQALARFSGNVAHDFNNLLTVIMASVSAFDDKPVDRDIRDAFRAVQMAASHAANLTHGMLLFGRRNAGVPKVLAVGPLLQQVQPILQQGLGRSHTLEINVQSEPCCVRIDSSQAQLMLLNLVVNARYAMPEGGRVTVDVSCDDLQLHDSRRPAELPPGHYVIISVTDNGEGIAPAIRSQIFEPFFTTRAPGNGSGLGLAACQGVAAQAGGAITVDSTLNEGSTFTVFLPESAPELGQPKPMPQLTVSSGGTERLLFVEDEPVLRQIFEKALREWGYKVQVADCAEAAIKLLETETFDLVVSDVVMPGMGGLALAQILEEHWPDVSILLISGNADSTHNFPFLAKPLTPAGLARRVRELLDSVE